MENALKNRFLLLAIVVILFLALLAFYFGMLQPSNNEITTQNAEIQTKTNQINILTKKANEKKANNANFSADKVQAALPLWDNIEQLTIDLGNVSKKTNISINNLSYSLGETNTLQNLLDSKDPVYPNIKEVKINITINGTFKNTMEWVSELQQLPRLITVESLSAEKPSTDTSAETKNSSSLALTAYFDPSYKDRVKDILEPSFNQ